MDNEAFFVSEPIKTPPSVFSTPLQEMVYRVLAELGIDFKRVDCQPAITMEDCQAIDAALQQKTVKTIFLCNRQKTQFYLFVTSGDKPFVTRDFSGAMGISRVSFAPADLLLEKMHTEVGATTIFSCLMPQAKDVTLVIDRDVLKDPVYGCADGTTTSYLRLATSDVFEKILPHFNRNYVIIDV